MKGREREMQSHILSIIGVDRSKAIAIIQVDVNWGETMADYKAFCQDFSGLIMFGMSSDHCLLIIAQLRFRSACT